MYNLWGKSVLAKMADKEGIFVEWIKELKGQPTIPGVYYLYLNKVDEQTRGVELIVKKFRSVEGKIPGQAKGSVIYFADNVDQTSLVLSDPTVQYSQGLNCIILQSYTPGPLSISNAQGPLMRMTDYWIVTQQTIDLLTTAGGTQVLELPSNWLSFTLMDKAQGYVMRPNVDYQAYGNVIEFGTYTPAGRVISATFTATADPSYPIHPENLLLSPLSDGEVLVPGQMKIITSAGNFNNSNLVLESSGYWLNPVLQPGYRCQWYGKIEEPDYTVEASKMSTNENIIPGLLIAIGDKTYEGDEVGVIVTQDVTQTYEVYGSNEKISFTIKVTANDRDTVNDLAGMLKEALLVKSRDRHEMLGLTIYEASMSTTTEARDSSGVQSTTTKEINISAASDWRYFSPLVNRVFDIDIDISESNDYMGYQLSVQPIAEAFGIRVWKGRTFTSNGVSS
jgi:hypothetical protein